MDIIPAIDILDNNVVKAIKGKRDKYRSINHKLYSTTNPRDIIYQIAKNYSPKIIYIADLDAIINNKMNNSFYIDIFSSFPKIIFWVDSGLNYIKLNKKYKNYQSVFCSERSQGYEMISNKFNKCVCSLDFMHKYLGKKFIYRHERANPSKVILMDMMQVGSNKKINYKLARKFIRNNGKEYYIAGGIKNMFDINKAKKMGASGVLVSSMLHKNKLSKHIIQKEKTSSRY